jgi:acyl carrier protein
MVFRWLRLLVFRTSAEKVEAFCEGRAAQPDEEFVAACGLPPGPEATRAALAVRRAVANLGAVDPGFIRAEDVYPDQLGVLPFWDSIDWLAFVLELEEQLGTKISTKEMEMSSIIPERVAVREWAAGVYRMLAARGGVT